jgi:hypothetical protein
VGFSIRISGRNGRERRVLPLALLVLAAPSTPAEAQRIENTVAVFAALDKVTARISRLEVKIGETGRFGALTITPRACYSRSPTEPPKTTTFVEVDELKLEGKSVRLFSGWMFAESPGLNAVEHPVFDLWLTECAGPVQATLARRPRRGEAEPIDPPAEPGARQRSRPRR